MNNKSSFGELSSENRIKGELLIELIWKVKVHASTLPDAEMPSYWERLYKCKSFAAVAKASP